MAVYPHGRRSQGVPPFPGSLRFQAQDASECDTLPKVISVSTPQFVSFMSNTYYKVLDLDLDQSHRSCS